MGAGLSMASVNKIKELANSREYSLALELVEHQDLTKSLNPQFLRLCGEIYIKNDRYKDARRCLIMAHRLGPESKRVLYTFVELYLRMGYFQLAKTYYDMYMFDANAYDSRDMEYVWNKHEHADDYKTLEPLIAGYAHNLDYDWSFELYLLYKKEEKQNEAATLAELYHASFKNSDNSQIILDIEAGKVKVDTYFDIYADTEAVDDDPDMEALRAEEQELLATDDLRMHPKEAEITIMYEDSYTPAGSEKKVQKMLKKQEREEQRKEKKLLKKQKQQEKAEAAAQILLPRSWQAAEAEKTEAEVKPATEEKTETETKVPETVADETEQKTSEKTTVTEQETAEKASVTETSEQKTAEEASETEAEEPEKEKKKGFFQRRKRKKHEEESETTDADIEETKEVTSESEDVKPSEEPKESNSDISSEIAETTGQAEDMRHGKGTIAKDVVVVDEDDGFEAEADTIEELASKEHVTQETETKEAEVTTAKKTTFEFQTVELAPEDFEEEYEVDDFSETMDDEFGEMKMPEPKPEIEETVEEEPETELEIEETVEEEPEIEERAEETVEEEPEVEEEIEEPEVVEPEPEIEAEPEPEIEETVEEAVKEEPEAELEIEETVEEEPEAEEEIEEPEVVEPEPEVEAEPELEIEETVEDVVEEEPETELEIEETVEEEPEVEVEIEEPEVVEPEPEVESESEPEIEEAVVEEAVEEEPETEEEIEELEEEPKEEFHVAPFTTKPEKKKLDFPVFKSSLFPDYHKEVKVVENNFNEIMEEAQDKMTENMQKEEQMQREAEALLASLGISMDAIPTTPKAEVKEEQPVQKGPSRDELKASLKIDSVKKNLLKRVKEYR